MLVIVRDETPGGRSLGEVTLEMPESITLRELIRMRVREEVARTNIEQGGGGARRVDWEQQADVVLHAFSKNGFVVLVGDRQVDDLNEELGAAAAVSFVRLVPLVGG
jgi:hypothetical protein